MKFNAISSSQAAAQASNNENSNDDLFKKIEDQKELDDHTKKLLDAADKKIMKSVYSTEFKDYAQQFEDKTVKPSSLLEKWGNVMSSTAYLAKVEEETSIGAAKEILKEATYYQDHQRYGVWQGIKEGFKNQVEGIEFAGYAAYSALTGDKSFYAKKAGGKMAENPEDVKWSDILTDLLWLGDTGSERGGKMFAADLLFLATGPLAGSLRVATVGLGKAVIKQSGKTVARNIAKEGSEAALKKLIKEGGEIKLTGIGKRWTEKSLNNAAKKLTQEQITASGKAVTKIPNELIMQNKLKLLRDGMSADLRITQSLVGAARTGADLINIPLGLNGRELFKGFIGYGAPIAAGQSGAFAENSQWFTQFSNKLTRQYANYNVTEYEKQLAANFLKATGHDPLSEDFELKNEWRDYMEFNLKNAGMMTILRGEDTGWGRFFNFMGDTIANLAGMKVGIAGASKGFKEVSNKMNIVGAADLTKQIDNYIKEKGINIRSEQADIDAFVNSVKNMEIKAGSLQDIQLMNRANQLVDNIITKSTQLASGNDTLTRNIAALGAEFKEKDFQAGHVKSKYEAVKLLSDKISDELKYNIENFSIVRESAELQRISEHFAKLQEQNNIVSKLRLNIAKNLSRGSSAQTRAILGGSSLPELMADRYKFLNEYAVNKALSSAEMAKNIANEQLIDIGQVKFLGDIKKIVNQGIEPTKFVGAIYKEVGDMVKEQFKNADLEVGKKLNQAVIEEGLLNVLALYNSMGRISPSMADFTRAVLAKNFGVDIVKQAASKTSKTLSDFLSDAEKMSDEGLRKVFSEAFQEKESIFDKEAFGSDRSLQRYNSLLPDLKNKSRLLAEKEYDLSNQLRSAQMEIKTIENQMNNIKAFTPSMVVQVEDGFKVGNKTYKLSKNAEKAAAKQNELILADTVKNINDSELIKSLIGAEEVKQLEGEVVKHLESKKTEAIQLMHKNIDEVFSSYKGVYDEYNKDLRIFNPDKLFIEDLDDNVSSSHRTINNFSEALEMGAPRMSLDIIKSQDVKVGDLTKLARQLSLNRSNKLSKDKNTNVSTRLESTEKAIRQIQKKLEGAKSLEEEIKNDKELIKNIIIDIEKELNVKGLSQKEAKILQLEKDKLMTDFEIMEAKRDFGSQANKEYLESLISNIDNRLKENLDIQQELQRSYKALDEAESKSKAIPEGAKKNEAALELANRQYQNLLNERSEITSAIFKNVFGKEALMELAKESGSPKKFYDTLSKRWKDAFNENIPEEFISPSNLNYKPVYNILNQSSKTERVVLNVTSVRADDGSLKFSHEMRMSNEPTLIDGTKIDNVRVKSVLESIAEDKGYEIREVAGMSVNGKNSNWLETIIGVIGDDKMLDRYSADQKLTDTQSKILHHTAQTIAGKLLIGISTNDSETINLMSANGFLAKVNGTKYDHSINKDVLRKSAEVIQAAVDKPEILNKALGNFIYSEILRPLNLEAKTKGYQLMGSLNEEGTRLYMVKGEDKIVDKFTTEVLSIKPENIGAKTLKRIKQEAWNEIHMNPEDIKMVYERAGIKRNINDKGEVMFKAIIIDDETYNKIKVNTADGELDKVSTDGQYYVSRFFQLAQAVSTGNSFRDDFHKGAGYVPGDRAFVLKGLANTLNEVEFSKQYFEAESLKGKSFDQAQKEFDIFIPMSTAKNLGYKFSHGETIEIPSNSYRIKRLGSNKQEDITFAFQGFTVFPAKMTGDDAYTKMYPKVMDNILKNINEKFGDFSDVIEKINLNPTRAADIIAESSIGKTILQDPSASKQLAKIASGMGYTGATKGMFESLLLSIFQESVVRSRVKGSMPYVVGIGDYDNINKAIVNHYKDAGITENNWTILSRNSYKDKVHFNKDGSAEIMSYRYPVTKPTNITVSKVIWWEDMPDNLKKQIPNPKSKMIANAIDLFAHKEADFDGDKIFFTNDKMFFGGKEGERFVDLVNHVNKSSLFDIVVNVSDKAEVDLNGLKTAPLNSSAGGVNEKDSFKLKNILKREEQYYKDANKIKSKLEKFSFNGMIDHINKFGQRVIESKNLPENPKGNSFMEKLYLLPNAKKLKKLETSYKIEKEASDYAAKKISEKIDKDIINSSAAKRFDAINKALTEESNSFKDLMRPLEAPFIGDISKEYKYSNGKIVDYKIGQSVKYYEAIKNDFLASLEKRTEGKKYTEAQAIRSERKALADVEAIIRRINSDIMNLTKIRNLTYNKYEMEANREILPDLSGENGKQIQRYILSKKWGGGANDSRAFFLIDKDIHNEYRGHYNQKFTFGHMKDKLGVDMTQKDAEKIASIVHNRNESLKGVEDETAKGEIIRSADREINKLISEKIKSANPSNKKLRVSELQELGISGKIVQDIVLKKAKNLEAETIFSINDFKEINSRASSILLNADATLIGKNIPQIEKYIDNGIRISFTEKDSAKGVNAKEATLSNIATLTAYRLLETKASLRVGSEMGSSGLKQSLINLGEIENLKRKAKAIEARRNEISETKADIDKEVTIQELTKSLEEAHKKAEPQRLKLERMSDGPEKIAQLEKEMINAERDLQMAFVKVFRETGASILNKNKSKYLRNFSAAEEFNKMNSETNKELAKLVELEPADFLNQMLQTYTKTYKSVAVGMMAGRIAIETVNNGLTAFFEGVKQIKNSKGRKSLFEKITKNIDDPKIPSAGKYDKGLFQDFNIKSLEGVSPDRRNKIMKGFEKKLSDIAGTISGEFINKPSSWMAQKFYEMKFNELLYKKVRDANTKKNYLLRDPNKLSYQERNKYNADINEITSKANAETGKHFFNYDMNPLIAHKLEKLFPFTNFMFSGARLVSKHPTAILGLNTLFQSLINNYGDQTGYILDDENGDPVRIDAGKRLKLPLLGMYGGFSMKFDRLLQFSPTEFGFGPAPLFSYMTGDYDWRVKKFVDGEMSGLELFLGAVSPSISQMAAGMVEDDYQKRWAGFSYILTGLATKSHANAQIAEDFFFKEDYEAVKNAPQSVKDSFYERMSKDNFQLNEKTLDSMLELQKLGLLSEPSAKDSFGVREPLDAYKQATRLHGQMITLAADGVVDPTKSEEFYKEMGRDVAEFNKFVAGSDIFEKMEDDPEWMNKVAKFVEAGHLDNYEKINQPYAAAMRHYYDNREYYSKRTEAKEVLDNPLSTDQEKFKAQAVMTALKYEIAGAGSSLNDKVNALISGNIKMVLDKDGKPVMTKERLAEIDYKGYFVAEYEKVTSDMQMHSDLASVFRTMYWASKNNNDKEAANYAWKEYEKHRTLFINKFKYLKEHSQEDADIYLLKRYKTTEVDEISGLRLTEPISNFVKTQKTVLNDFYNMEAAARVEFLNNTDNKWSQLTNMEKAEFRVANNGLTINQAREKLGTEIDIYSSMIDSNAPKLKSDRLNKLKQIYE